MRHGLPLLALVLLAAPAGAGTREDVYQAFQRCNVMHDNRVWLDCIYGAVQPIRSELKLSPAPEGQVRLVPPVSLASAAPAAPAATARAPAPVTHPEPRREGLIHYMLGGRKQVEEMPFRDYRFDGTHHFTVTLANGQVWRQADDDSHIASWRAEPAQYVASIRTGSLGSSILMVRGESGAFLVKQVP